MCVSRCSGPNWRCRAARHTPCHVRGLDMLPYLGQVMAEVAHAGQRLGMLGPEYALPRRYRLLCHACGRGMLFGLSESYAEVGHADQRLGVLRPEHALPL